jgi:hypothetical protein
MSYLQEQGGAANVARFVHPEGQRMVRERLRQEEHPEQHGLGFNGGAGHAGDQRQYGVVERFVGKGGWRVEAGAGIQIGVIGIENVFIQNIFCVQIVV